jgi:hypothetical protein
VMTVSCGRVVTYRTFVVAMIADRDGRGVRQRWRTRSGGFAGTRYGVRPRPAFIANSSRTGSGGCGQKQKRSDAAGPSRPQDPYVTDRHLQGSAIRGHTAELDGVIYPA